jgi:hypothetical protein
MRSLWIVALLLIASCDPQERKEERTSIEPAPAPSTAVTDGDAIQFPQIDDNITNDTLLIQTTFDLGDGTFLMVASHSQTEERLDAGDRNAGLRLYHYKLDSGSPVILATSSSAHDSWTMFPTFFKDPRGKGYILLCNFGERDSWGQKVIRFDQGGFTDMGFINAAMIERNEDEDDGMTLRSIAPSTKVTWHTDEIRFTFEGDELLLFDDLRGNIDLPIEAKRVSYRWDQRAGMRLFIDGEERREDEPS